MNCGTLVRSRFKKRKYWRIMARRKMLLGAVLVILVSMAPAISQSPEVQPSIVNLSWISGDWQIAPGGRAQLEEHWTIPAGGSMLGMSRTIANEKTVEFEYL